jgi:hypothetical protein
VVLDRERLERTPGERSSTLDDVVVEADVVTVATPYGGLGGRVERCVDGEPVVVRGHLDLAGGAVHDRLVDAAVAVLELVGAEAEGPAEQLVAEADPEVRQSRAQRACSSSTWRGRAAGSPGPLE